MNSTKTATGSIRPTLYIGLGGTGKEILLRLRRRIYERFGKGVLPFTSFLWVDLDVRDVDARGEQLNEVLKRVQFEPHEKIELLNGTVGSDFGAMLRDQNTFRHIHQWLYPEVQRYGSGVADGAGGIRAVGRLAWYNRFASAISSRIPEALRDLSAMRSINETISLFESRGFGAPDFSSTPQVFVICSVAGGTGGGTLVDTLFYLRQLQDKGTPTGDVFSIIVLPNVYYPNALIDWRAKRSYGNAYAALKEIEHYSVRVMEGTDQAADFEAEWQANNKLSIPGPPFSAAYLIEMQNESGGAIPNEDRRELFDSIGSSLYLDLMPSKFSSAKRGSYSNVVGKMATLAANPINLGDENGVLRQEFAQRYATFGNARIEVPVEVLVRACGCRLTKEICLYLNRVIPSDWLEGARREGSARRLDRKGIQARLGQVWRDAVTTEVANVFAKPIVSHEDVEVIGKKINDLSEELFDQRRGRVPAAMKAASDSVKKEVESDIDAWIRDALEDDLCGPNALCIQQGLIGRMLEEYAKLTTGLSGQGGELTLGLQQAETDANAFRVRCEYLAKEARTGVVSFGLRAFAVREGVVETLREQYRDALSQHWLARAERFLIEATLGLIDVSSKRLREWQGRIQQFVAAMTPWAERMSRTEKELLNFPDQALSIRLYRSGDFDLYYLLNGDAVQPKDQATAYAKQEWSGGVLDLLVSTEQRGAEATVSRLRDWTEERFHNDVDANPRMVNIFSYPAFHGQKLQETTERLIKAALPMLRHRKDLGAKAMENIRECYLGVPNPDDQQAKDFIETVKKRLQSNGLSVEVSPTGDPTQIFLYIADYGFALPLVNLVANECHDAYNTFYTDRLNSKLQGQQENQIPLHLSHQWEGQLSDLKSYTDGEARQIAEVRKLLLFGEMLNVVQREEQRSASTYWFRRGMPLYDKQELGNFRDTLELLCVRDDLQTKLIVGVQERERGLNEMQKKSFYLACHYLLSGERIPTATPEASFLRLKLSELNRDLNHLPPEELRPVGSTAAAKAQWCLDSAAGTLEVRLGRPVLVSLPAFEFAS